MSLSIKTIATVAIFVPMLVGKVGSAQAYMCPSRPRRARRNAATQSSKAAASMYLWAGAPRPSGGTFASTFPPPRPAWSFR